MSCRCHVRSLYLLYVAERFYQVPAGRRFKISPRSLWNPSYQVSGLGAQCLQFASTSPLLFFAQTAAKIVILSLNKFVICNYLSWLFGWFFGFILFLYMHLVDTYLLFFEQLLTPLQRQWNASLVTSWIICLSLCEAISTRDLSFHNFVVYVVLNFAKLAPSF